MTSPQTLSPRFHALYQNLRLADLKRGRLANAETAAPSDSDISYLMMVASRLALESGNESPEAALQCQLAYDIAVRGSALMSTANNPFSDLGQLVLSRLGNFPARTLLNQALPLDESSVSDPFLVAECHIRSSENYRSDVVGNFSLTDFQVRLLDLLSTKQSVSVSAPTSAGKSLAMELELVRLLRKATGFVGVFIVPTRALIRQVSFDLLALVKTHDLFASVITSPVVPELPEDDLSSQNLIFVLTQERFATLIQEAPAEFSVSAIIADEAHEICRAKRGQTLERVIQLALARFPSASIFFSSPLRSNPEYLLELFKREGEQSAHFIEYRSPVSQNLIFLKQVKGSPRKIAVSAWVNDAAVDLQVLEVPFKFRNNCLGEVATYFTAPGETSIIYCNRPSSADKAASEIAATCDATGDEDLEDFANFLKSEVHRLYKLADLVRRGVSFHYSNIPQIVRGRIEELVKERKIRFVACTSTLLQGMNLPAKNIFVDNPRTGQGEEGTISTGDFWNLIGRAGRLGKEFSGNVYCLLNDSWNVEPLIADKFVPIESAYQVAIRIKTPELAFYAKQPPQEGEAGALWAVQAFASIYAERLANGVQLSAIVNDPEKAVAVAEIDEAVTAIRARQTLPDEVFLRNLYVHPSTLEELAEFLRTQPDILSWIPLLPISDTGGLRLRRIMQLIEIVFLKTGTKSYVYYSFLASAWMQGTSIRELLKGRLTFQGIAETSENVNREARNLFREIEEQIRYVYVKYTHVYNQVLRAVLVQRSYPEQAEKLVPLHLFLEFGASSKTLISLMSLGLSRTCALLLRSSASLRHDMEVPACKDFLGRLVLERSDLPAICKHEIRRVKAN